MLAFLLLVFIYLTPQSFYDLWLTKDQQGQLLFKWGDYQQAANTFTDIRWQAYSHYAAENFEQAALLYGQFEQNTELLASANAMAHGRHYIKAKQQYQRILAINPEYKAAQTNLNIVQAIINEINITSKQQKSESGQTSKNLADEPQTSEGVERKVIQQEVLEQFSAEQLLQDPKLSEMWLRQVQKNPADFLINKFNYQFEQQEKKKDIKITGDNNE